MKRREAIALGLKTYESDKPCKRCGEKLKWTLPGHCTKCSLERVKKYRAENHEHTKKIRRVKTEVLEKLGVFIKKGKRYEDDPKPRFNKGRSSRNHNTALDRVKKANAIPKWVDKEHLKLIRGFYREAHKKHFETGVLHEVDHIIPLNGKNVCGLHVHWNLRVVTKTENKKKLNKVLEYI
jgi:ribosomal protein L37E